jgi:uncharacterized protein (DUF1778 family)
MVATKSRINIRVAEPNLELIRDAAAANGQDLTSFVLGAALERARTVLLTDRVTRLNAAEAAAFETALDADAAAPAALVELLQRTATRAGSAPQAVERQP